MVISITGTIIDIIIVALAVCTTYMGYRKGLSSVLYKIISFVISLIIVFILYQPDRKSVV